MLSDDGLEGCDQTTCCIEEQVEGRPELTFYGMSCKSSFVGHMRFISCWDRIIFIMKTVVDIFWAGYIKLFLILFYCFFPTMLNSCNISCMYTSRICMPSYIELPVSPFSSDYFSPSTVQMFLSRERLLAPKVSHSNGNFGWSVSILFSLLSFICFFPFLSRSDLPVSHSDAEGLHRIHRIKYMYISRYISCLDASVDIKS